MVRLYPATKFLVIAFMFVHPLFVWGTDQASNKQVEEIRTAVERLFGSGYKVKSVKKTDLEYIFEVRINNELVYVNREVTHMFIEGQLIQLSNGKNLTEERKNEILSINFRDLPFQQAIVSDFKKSDKVAVREIAVFEDPNCGYCRKFRRSLSKIENLRVYTFLYPILGESSVTVSKNVWCSANPSQTWDELMLNDVEPSDIDAISCKFNLESFLAVGKNLGIQATPTIFLSSGERLRGAVSEERLREKLDLISAGK